MSKYFRNTFIIINNFQIYFLLIAAVFSEDVVKSTEQKTDDGTIRPTTEENGFGPTGSENSTANSIEQVPEISEETKHPDTLVEAENTISESSSDTTTLPYSTVSESHKKSRDDTTAPPPPTNNKGKVRTITIRKEVRYAIPHAVPIHIEKQVPFPVRIPVEIPVDRPYPVHVVQPYPIAVEKQIPYPVAISSPVAVPVPHPFLIKQLVPIIISERSNFHDGHYIGDYEDQETIQNDDKGRHESSHYNRYNPSNQGTYVNTIEGQYPGNKNVLYQNNVYQNNAAGVPNKFVGSQIGLSSSSGFQTTSIQNNNVYVPTGNSNIAQDTGRNLKPTQVSTSSFHNQQNSVSNAIGDGRSESVFQNSSPQVQNGAGRSESVFQNNSPLVQSGITSNYLRVTSSSSGNSPQNAFSDGSSPVVGNEQQNFGHIGQTPYSNEAASINQGINSFSNHASAQGFSESLVSRTQSSLGGSVQFDDSYVRSNIPQSKFQISSYGPQNQNLIINSQGNQLASTNTFNTAIPTSNPFGAQRTISTNQLLAAELTRH